MGRDSKLRWPEFQVNTKAFLTNNRSTGLPSSPARISCAITNQAVRGYWKGGRPDGAFNGNISSMEAPM